MDNTLVIIIVVALVIAVIVGVVLMRKNKESFSGDSSNEPAKVSYVCSDPNSWVMTVPIGALYARMSTEFSLSNTQNMQSSPFNLFDGHDRPNQSLTLNADGSILLNNQIVGLRWQWKGSVIIVTNSPNQIISCIMKCDAYQKQQLGMPGYANITLS